jgi:dimeric dUTPase (all-alpha-NTP-PPase superfamily)
MVIDLNEILIEQDKLNRSIFEKHQIIFKQVEGEIKLALLVELGELANEIRSFKY